MVQKFWNCSFLTFFFLLMILFLCKLHLSYQCLLLKVLVVDYDIYR